MGKRKARNHSRGAFKAAQTSGKRLKQDSDDSTPFTTPSGQVLPAEIKKYWNKRYMFFWRFDEGIQIDNEGWYSVTPEVIAQDTAQRIAQLHNQHKSSNANDNDYGRICVVDAFCGVGGNSIKFAEWCEHVIAIDIDPVRLEMARNNAEVYGVADRIEFILGDFYELAPRLKADVVFMSPPWGGPEYIGRETYDLDAMPFHSAQEWMDRARLVTDNIVYFMPRNCVPAELAKLYPEAHCDIELNFTGSFFKSITAYYGDLALFGSSEPLELCM
ncbi:Trimethylguanosine synthase [Coemansia sp. Benny D115]|nr:Trimethylguanosine synthase [Coemansia sp. Benny D115]